MSTLNLTQAFDVRSGEVRVPLGAQQGPPGVACGTLWSNEIDMLWLYNGQSIWCFDTELGSWKIVQAPEIEQNATTRVGGAGLSVPSRATGYYLGGYAEGFDHHRSYYHSLMIFDMKEGKLRSQPVPEQVPIVAPVLVYLDAGDNGLLVVIGGKHEKTGALTYASCLNVPRLEVLYADQVIGLLTNNLRL